MSRQSPPRKKVWSAGRRIRALQSYCMGGTCGHHVSLHVGGVGCTGQSLTGPCECRHYMARVVKVPESGGVR